MPRYSGRNRRSSSSSRSRSPYDKHQRERSRSSGRSRPTSSRFPRRMSSSPRHRSGARRSSSYRRSSPRRYSRSRSRSPRQKSNTWRSSPRRSSPRRSSPRRSSPRRSSPRRSSPRRSSPRRSSPRRSSPRRSSQHRRSVSPWKSPPRKRSSSPNRGSSKRYQTTQFSYKSRDGRSRSVSPLGLQQDKKNVGERKAGVHDRRSSSTRDGQKRGGVYESGPHGTTTQPEWREGTERETGGQHPQRGRERFENKDRQHNYKDDERWKRYEEGEVASKERSYRHEGDRRTGPREEQSEWMSERRQGTSSVHTSDSAPRQRADEDFRKAPGFSSQSSWDHHLRDGDRSKVGRDTDLRPPKQHSQDERSSKLDYSAPHPDKGNSSRKLGNTGTSLHDRFATSDSRRSPFTPDENITVGIERNIPGDEEPIIERVLNPDDVILVRRSSEGELPLYEREEFKGPKEEEYMERRVVRVVRPEADSVRHYEQQFQRENFEVRRDRFQSRKDLDDTLKPSLHERWGKPDERKIEPTYSKREKQRVEVVYREDRYARESSDKADIHRGDTRNFEINRSGQEAILLRHTDLEDRKEKVLGVYGDKDERIISERYTASGSSKTSVFRRDEDMRVHEREKFEKDPRDLRHNLARRRSSGAGKDDHFDARQKITEKRREDDRRKSDSERVDVRRRGRLESVRSTGRIDSRQSRRDNLPDFSKRADKGNFEEWKAKPEMVPKGFSYFEHDNRGEVNYWQRRGRGARGRGFRGLGSSSRGGYRGRGQRRSSFGGGDWKHDKFAEMEDDADNKPSSTTT